MFDQPFELQLVTPEKVVFSGDVRVVSAPGSEGGFQVLRSHAPLLTALDAGRIRVRDTNDAEIDYATSGGFLEVRDNLVTILAESAEISGSIDIERAKRSKARAEERLHNPPPGLDVERARASLARAVNRIKIAQG